MNKDQILLTGAEAKQLAAYLEKNPDYVPGFLERNELTLEYLIAEHDWQLELLDEYVAEEENSNTEGTETETSSEENVSDKGTAPEEPAIKDDGETHPAGRVDIVLIQAWYSNNVWNHPGTKLNVSAETAAELVKIGTARVYKG